MLKISSLFYIKKNVDVTDYKIKLTNLFTKLSFSITRDIIVLFTPLPAAAKKLVASDYYYYYYSIGAVYCTDDVVMNYGVLVLEKFINIYTVV